MHLHKWNPNNPFFATDFRPEFNTSESWEFDVTGIEGSQANLAFSGIEQLPEKLDVYLIHKETGKTVNLRETDSYSFPGVGAYSKFEFIVGLTDFVHEELIRINTPIHFKMENNYPNPFNSSTTMTVSIPRRSEVELIIFNLLGEKICTLIAGDVEAGNYQFVWDGRNESGTNVSSGVYFVRLHAEKFTAMKKLLYVR